MENGIVVLPISYEMEAIINNLRKRDWLISNHCGNADLYSPISYLYNSGISKTKYLFLLDRNILIYILSGYKNPGGSDIYRDAIGLVAFCQFSEIIFDISLAIHERVAERVDIAAATEEIELFYQIDDGDYYELEKYATGQIEQISINPRDVSVLKQKIINWYNDYSYLSEWKSMYVITLKIIHIYSIAKETKYDGFCKLIDWMQDQYRYSLVCIVFSFFLFSDKRIKNQMKYNPNHESSKRRLEIINMTWDLYIMNYYFRKLQQKVDNEEFIIVTADIALKKVLTAALDVQLSLSTSAMKKYLDKSDYPMIDYLDEKYRPQDESRAFNASKSMFSSSEYRQHLIETLEKELL